MTTAVVTAHDRCRLCAAPLLPILSLGPLYLSDFPRSAGTKAHPPVPLDLARCADARCGLVQLAHTTPPAWLYGDQYWYRSGVNETMVAELRDVVTEAARRVDLPRGATVVDIGANDGTLLQQYPLVGCPSLLRVAWEPSVNFYEVLRPHASVLFPEYFRVGAGDGWGSPKTKARIVTAVAMFYDLDDPHAFVADVATILHPEGVFVIQQAYLPTMLAAGDFTNVVHEHLEYYHLRPLEALLARHGLEVVDVDLRAINGGSLRTYVRFAGVQPVSDKVAQIRREEAILLADPDQVFRLFAARVGATVRQLQAVLHAYAERGAPVDLYAASTKANTLLQVCGLDARTIRQAWERSPEKWGRYAGVSGIPIVREAEGRVDPPSALLLGAWQFRDAFVERERAYLGQGGRIIVPLPAVETVQQQEVAQEKTDV